MLIINIYLTLINICLIFLSLEKSSSVDEKWSL